VDTLERVREIIADITQNPIGAVKENSSSRTVDGWDAAAQLSIMVTIEMDFGISFTDEEMRSLNGVKKIVHAVKDRPAAA